jgi:hypothetical protein
MDNNLICIAPDTPIFRVFRRKYIGELLHDKKLRLVPPSSWADPFEDMLIRCAITDTRVSPWQQKFFDQIRWPIRAQCWSAESDADALWQIYSRFDRDEDSGRNKVADEEGIQVRTRAVELLKTLWDNFAADQDDACFLGAVHYMPEAELGQYIADEIGKSQQLAFDGGRGHADSVLFKRNAFLHEREVRLVYVGSREIPPPDPLFLAVEPNELIDGIVLDPRLTEDEARERQDELRSMGYSGSIDKSQLYQRRLWEIVIKP